MFKKNTLIKGTVILTITGLTTRLMGFFYRLFLSNIFGAEGVGLYQLIFPVYALGFSLTSAGIELALARCISKHITLGNTKRAKDLLYTSLILTFIFSIIVTLILQHFSDLISVKYLHSPKTKELLILLSYIFPFSSVHSCIVGYNLGYKKANIPAVSQLLEQTFRITSVIFLYKFCTVYGIEFNILFAVLGLIIGEFASCLFCFKTISNKILPFKIPSLSIDTLVSCTKELLFFSLPVTLNRTLLNILQSFEALSIPFSLIQYGFNQKEAISIYGVLTGMALPFILFPSSITNSISTMLLPTVSEIHTLKNLSILNAILKKIFFSCTLMGLFCCFFFSLFGNQLGTILFNNILAGKFIVTLAWLCPFLYTNTTLISSINGIGKTSISFFINIINLSIRILSIFLLIPSYGIYGYLLGLLFSQFITFILCILYLKIQLKAEVI